ncbi:ubiquitin carboxyl-terminal hydrolase [Polychytrium aggregatum]|uniref:ubiquitin carboxyl-terminal hydrolase n=1 Tax=Polychytrium aggregatum TaxID=110093 RepID=UPI0022FF23D9|nr:ubiquitin carboxyl-terminal hydrolase [Polychytrium aggregatum]KAI9202116.1 ubiquitin carboxyl-terminal hydrolase [Polychytrium aggregatum]
MESGNWTLIESDPGVFTELIEGFGVPNCQVEEIFDLEQLDDIKPVYGLIFLFKYQRTPPTGTLDPSESVFFAQQVINNACATQAILSILMNSPIELGPMLSEFKTFTSEFPPDLKGLAISNSDQIRTVHNSFARADPFILDQSHQQDDDEDVFHFISYLHIHGCLYELDGLQPAPINHGPCTEGTWTDAVKPIIQSRIARYSSQEIRFNLMALIKSRTQVYQQQLETIQEQLDSADVDSEVKELLGAERHDLEARLQSETAKRSRWRKENERRRFNYIGFTFGLIEELAKSNRLGEILGRQTKEAI